MIEVVNVPGYPFDSAFVSDAVDSLHKRFISGVKPSKVQLLPNSHITRSGQLEGVGIWCDKDTLLENLLIQPNLFTCVSAYKLKRASNNLNDDDLCTYLSKKLQNAHRDGTFTDLSVPKIEQHLEGKIIASFGKKGCSINIVKSEEPGLGARRIASYLLVIVNYDQHVITEIKRLMNADENPVRTIYDLTKTLPFVAIEDKVRKNNNIMAAALIDLVMGSGLTSETPAQITLNGEKTIASTFDNFYNMIHMVNGQYYYSSDCYFIHNTTNYMLGMGTGKGFLHFEGMMNSEFKFYPLGRPPYHKNETIVEIFQNPISATIIAEQIVWSNTHQEKNVKMYDSRNPAPRHAPNDIFWSTCSAMGIPIFIPTHEFYPLCTFVDSADDDTLKPLELLAISRKLITEHSGSKLTLLPISLDNPESLNIVQRYDNFRKTHAGMKLFPDFIVKATNDHLFVNRDHYETSLNT